MRAAFLWAASKPRIVPETDFDHVMSLVDVVGFLNVTDKVRLLVTSASENSPKLKSSIDNLIDRKLFSSYLSLLDDFQLDQSDALSEVLAQVKSVSQLVSPEPQLTSLLQGYLRNIEKCGYRFLPLGLRLRYHFYFRQRQIPLNHPPCNFSAEIIGAVQNPGVAVDDVFIFSETCTGFAHAPGFAIDFLTASAITVNRNWDTISLSHKAAITTARGRARLWLPTERDPVDLGYTRDAWLKTNGTHVAIVRENAGRYDLYIYPDLLDPLMIALSPEALGAGNEPAPDWLGFAEDSNGGLYLVDSRRALLMEHFNEACIYFSKCRLRPGLRELCDKAKVAVLAGSDEGYDDIVSLLGSHIFDKKGMITQFARFLIAPFACSLQ